MSSIGAKALLEALSVRYVRTTRFLHHAVFGTRNLLITNALISASMGALGDSIQQNYDILMGTMEKKKKKAKEGDDSTKEASSHQDNYNVVRTGHMTAAGLTTGVVTHYWYIFLDRFLGQQRTAKVLAKKILLDQCVGSPMSLISKCFRCSAN